MGVERIRSLAESLVRHGMAADTPVGMVRWGTTGQQESIEGTLGTIADMVEEKQFKAPAVTVIGDVVKLRDKLNWAEKRPLFGQRIVVTRTREQASQLSRQLLELGAEVLEIPTIKIVPPDDPQDLIDAILGLNAYDWLIFTSPNGVTTFFDYFFKTFDDLRDIGGARLAAIGPATAAKLKELHLKVDLMPEEYLTKKIVSAFQGYESIENLRMCLLRAQVANPDLPRTLEEEGAIVDDVACYKTVSETEDRNGAAARMLEAGADWITFTSSSTV
jgi:uroporphyrinogen III methyltransferase/synthase